MDSEIQAINDRLKAAGISVRVEPKGKNLALRTTLPKKPEHGVGRKQYSISLRVSNTRTGRKRAENEAHALDRSLNDGTFSWSQYLNPQVDQRDKPIHQWIEELKVHYLATHRIKESTWGKEWRSTFNKLPQDEPLTEGLILAVVLSTKLDTCARQRTCQRMQHLAEFAGITIDLSPHVGNYDPKPRDIPDDDLILEIYKTIPNSDWRWIYGMIATFGLRPHECFDCRFVDRLTVAVKEDTKTGERLTKAIPPDWVDLWKLDEGSPPPGKTRSATARGASVSKQFGKGKGRYDLPIQAYDLRHAFAIRVSVTNKIPLPTAAAWMGHSVATHTKTYHRWLKASTNEQIYQSMILGKSSPPTS